MRTKYIWKLRSTLQIYEGLYIIMLPHNWMLMHLSERIQLYQKCCKINIFLKSFCHSHPHILIFRLSDTSFSDLTSFASWDPILIYWKARRSILRGRHGNNHLGICWNFDWVWQILNQKPIQITIWRWDERDQKYLKSEIFDQTFVAVLHNLTNGLTNSCVLRWMKHVNIFEFKV